MHHSCSGSIVITEVHVHGTILRNIHVTMYLYVAWLTYCTCLTPLGVVPFLSEEESMKQFTSCCSFSQVDCNLSRKLWIRMKAELAGLVRGRQVIDLLDDFSFVVPPKAWPLPQPSTHGWLWYQPECGAGWPSEGSQTSSHPIEQSGDTYTIKP